jgi:hypothetical protein
MASNQERQGANRSGSSNRGFAAMDGDEQRRIARKGGQASARVQQRDQDGQFAGRRTSNSTSSGASGGSGSRGQSAGGRRQGGQSAGGRSQGGQNSQGGASRSAGSNR